MLYDDLFFEVDDFIVTQVERANGKLTMAARSRQKGNPCPACSTESNAVQGYYYRLFMDLPILGYEVWIRLKSRKFYCRNNKCQMKVFTERFQALFSSRKRKTDRVQERILKVALLMGGNGGEKTCRSMNIPVSSSSLIRSIHLKVDPIVQAPRVVGLDDWAYKKGKRYGTVLVDMERKKVIDLLPDREAATVENWLKKYPQIEIVSRDRYINYAVGVSNALPQAQQVADRWHLVKNLGDATQRVLERLQSSLKQKARLPCQQQSLASVSQSTNQSKSALLVQRKQRIMDEVKKLHLDGTGVRAISRKLNLHRATVKKYLELEIALPKNSVSGLKVFLFEYYIRNAITTRPGVKVKELYQEIVALGYKGKKTVGQAHISKYMPKIQNVQFPKDLPLAYWRPAQVSFLLYRKENELSGKELELISYLRKESEEVEKCFSMVQRFRIMMENKEGNKLKEWIVDAMNSSIKELKSFGQGVLNDFSAVQNALELPWSNGQVEGQVNKLKMMKRQMYGRASFNLLRKRLICESE